VLPSSTTETAAVTDFKFSPDGKVVAYRLDDGRLALALAPAWQEQAVDLDGPVTRYAWSPNSSVLAIAYTSGGTTWLGGVRVAPASGSFTDGGAGGASSTTDGGSTA